LLPWCTAGEPSFRQIRWFRWFGNPEMARFQAMNDQRPAADRVGLFMDHLKRTLDSPEGARAPKVRPSS